MGKGDGLRAIWVEAFSHDLGFKEVRFWVAIGAKETLCWIV